MPPKARAKAKARGVRRPAARGEGLRRPAAPEEVEDEAEVRGRRRSFAAVGPHELVKLGPIWIKDGLYYGRKVQLAGEIVDVKVQGGQLYAEVKASGTQDEELLRVLSGKVGKIAKLHLCGPDCGQVLTKETLLHGREFEEVDLNTAPWMTNLKEARPGGEEVDEMAKLREAQRREGAVRVGSDSPERKKRKKKKEKKKEDEGRETKSPRRDDLEVEVGQKDLKVVYQGTGMDSDIKQRVKMTKKAQNLSRNRQKTKKKKDEKISTSLGGASSSSSSTASEDDAVGLFSEESRLKQLSRRCPGVLSAQAITEMKASLMTGSGTMRSLERSSLCPLWPNRKP